LGFRAAAHREFAFYYRSHARREIEPGRLDGEFHYSRPEKPDLHHSLLHGFDRQRKQRSSLARVDFDDGQGRQWDARDDAGTARLRARFYLAFVRDCLDLAIAR